MIMNTYLNLFYLLITGVIYLTFLVRFHFDFNFVRITFKEKHDMIKQILFFIIKKDVISCIYRFYTRLMLKELMREKFLNDSLFQFFNFFQYFFMIT
jgi:hypothetical protein